MGTSAYAAIGVLCLAAGVVSGAVNSRQRAERSPALRLLVVPMTEKSGCPSVGSAGSGLALEPGGTARTWLARPRDYGVVTLDRNLNGLIDDPSELVSNRITSAATGGFNALIDLALGADPDRPHVEAGHPLYARLFLWVDSNENAHSDFSELRPLSEFLALVGLGMDRLPGGTPCRFKGWGIRQQDWTGRLRSNDRLHPIFEITLPQRP